jgi:hypothetical protein
MRGFLVMAMFVASLSNSIWNEFNVEPDLTVDIRAVDAFDIGDHFVKNPWLLDESPALGSAQVIDAPCASRHIESDTDHPVPDII